MKPSETESTYVVRVERQRVWCPLRTAPKRLPTTRYGVFWKTKQQLTYSVIVPFLKLQPSPSNAFFKSDRSIFHKIRRNLFDLFLLLARVFKSAFEVVWFGEV